MVAHVVHGTVMRAKFIITSGLALVICGDVHAYCFEPSAPSCATGYGAFNDEWEFNSCKSEMENFESEVEEFGQCKQREVDEANEEAEEAAEQARREASEAEDIASKARREVEGAVSNYSDAVRDFNARAGG